MKKIIFIFLLLACYPACASWSQFVHITPENEATYSLQIKATVIDKEHSVYQVTIQGYQGQKEVHIITTSEYHEPKDQEFRFNIWRDYKKPTDIELLARLKPFKGENDQNIYFVRLSGSTMKRSYIYIDSGHTILDGGYYFSIDLSYYIDSSEKNLKNDTGNTISQQK